MMDIRTLREILATGDVLGMRACTESLWWLDTLPQDAPAQHAWDTCERASWMRWLAQQVEYRVGGDLVSDAIGDLPRSLPDAIRARIGWETVERVLRGES